jgi:predicted acylesterase/phospholipase RssA
MFTTDLTVVVNLSGPTQIKFHPDISHMATNDGGYRKRIGKFIDGLKPAHFGVKTRHDQIDVAFASIQAMQGTISQLGIAGLSPDVKIDIPCNACDFIEFWRAEELIAM